MVKNVVKDLGEYVSIVPNGKHSDKSVLLDKSDLPKLGNNTVVSKRRRKSQCLQRHL